MAEEHGPDDRITRSSDGVVCHDVAVADAPETVACLVRSFWDYPETCHLLPGERSRRRVLPRYLRSDAEDSARFGALRAVRHDGVVIGAAAWLEPGGYPVPWCRQVAEAGRLLPILPWALGAAARGRKGQAANRTRHEPCPPHFWLRVVGVDPAHHGRGIGSRLVRSMLADADAGGHGSFLFTATAVNARWYESFGFVVTDTYRPTATWPTVWSMWRDPPPNG